MISIPHKAKQFLVLSIKLLIVCMAFYYIYWHFQENNRMNWPIISYYFSWKTALVLIILSILNWLLEILKWQNLVGSFKKISFLEASKQSLGSLTASIFTPNRIGEYGAKILYFPKEEAKKVLFLNFINNSSQMLVTCFFGIFGLVISTLTIKSNNASSWFSFKLKTIHFFILIALIILSILMIKYRKIELYGFSLQKSIKKIKKVPSYLWRTNFQLAAMRYLLFSHQFYFLLVTFNCDIDYSTALATIFIMYLLASIIPSIQFIDVAIKGSVALYLFSFLGIENTKVITITSLMWVFNLVIPVLIGVYFVLRFKPQKE